MILAPSNLGLRPLHPGHEPGTWRAPAALMEAGLLDALRPSDVTELSRPTYSPEPQPGTRLRNGPELRRFNLELADAVEHAVRSDEFALVLGGDCSIMLGALAGARRLRPLSLLHIDGHSDFRHPGNYDVDATLGAVAGMDLALATGRGEATATEWPGCPVPLVEDHHVIQLGERENRDADFAWPDVNETKITQIDVFEANRSGLSDIIARIDRTLAKLPSGGLWIHLDVDVLDQSIMPAVDCPGSPGLSPNDLQQILQRYTADLRCLGMTVTVFDPDLDPEGVHAKTIVEILSFIALQRGPGADMRQRGVLDA
ncbi:arginase family protein [Salipiger sp. IMCC34102]|uniref:arginase family protein n=1 Tax=Salipiger sp. IMCC34102 TaxID=2510647 RepID=UPI001A92AD3A|nr:arginase family protein [Salipiger sp. IMCC34102]